MDPRRASSITTFSLDKGELDAEEGGHLSREQTECRINYVTSIQNPDTPKYTSGPKTKQAVPKPVEPRKTSPETTYEYVHEVHPGNGRNYCSVMVKATRKDAYSTFIIRRKPIEAIFKLERPSPYALNLIEAFEWKDSLYCVYDRPGIPLPDIVLTPGLNFSHMKTIIYEVRLLMLGSI